MNASPSPNPYPPPIAPRFDLEDVVAELVRARRTIAEKSLAVEEAKLLLADRRTELAAAIRAKEEIEDELTDPAKRPMAAIWNRPAAGEASADEHRRGPSDGKVIDVSNLPKPKRNRKGERSDRREKKPEPWQDVALSEILPDDPPDGVRNADIIDKVAAHLELLENRSPTVGDIALIWFSERDQPHTLEEMHSLTDSERETLRSTLAGFRIQRGWESRVAMPDGFPLAWLRPEPTADIVIDPMAAAKEDPADDQVDEKQPDGGHVEWTSGDLERELKCAVTSPMGIRTDAWDTFYGLGYVTDVQIAEVLRSIWPKGHGCNPATASGAKKRIGYTVHGWPYPKFWVGARRPETLNKPTLQDRALIDRVRGILGLPRATPAMLADARAQVHAEEEGLKATNKRPRKAAKPAGVES